MRVKRPYARSQLLLHVLGDLDLTVVLFKFGNTAADEVQDLAVAAPSLVFGNIVELVMENGVYFDAEMLVCFVSHKNHLKVRIL